MTIFEESKLGDTTITINKTLNDTGEYQITVGYSVQTKTIKEEIIRELRGAIYEELTAAEKIFVDNIIKIVENKANTIAGLQPVII